MTDNAPATMTSEIDDEHMASGDEGSPEPDVVTLVAGRDKRATAGNRLHALLDKEDDDELELLFAENEEEEDVEFKSEDEAGSDLEMDSSSDDDDHGPAAGAEDLDGERELERLAKVERKKQRKQQAILKRPQRRIERKLQGEPINAPNARPTVPKAEHKKKVERVSWLPTIEGEGVRASKRNATVQAKAAVHDRLKEYDKRRKHVQQVMDAAAKRKQADKPKALSQADRMAEAARVERQNAKSLNRWEEEERRRAEERRAKLAALKNRKLEGPYVTFWSGPAIWVDGKLAATGRGKSVEEVKAGTVAKAKARAVAMAQLLKEEHNKNEAPSGGDETQPATSEGATSEANRTRQSTAAATDVQQSTADKPQRMEAVPNNEALEDRGKGSAPGEAPKETPKDVATTEDPESARSPTAPAACQGPNESTEKPDALSLDPPAAPDAMEAVSTSQNDVTKESVPAQGSNTETTSTNEAAPKPAEPQPDPMAIDEPETVLPGAPKDVEEPAPSDQPAAPPPAASTTASEPPSAPVQSKPSISLEDIIIPEPTVTKSARTLIVLENVKPGSFPNHVLMAKQSSQPVVRQKRTYRTAKVRAAEKAAAERAAELGVDVATLQAQEAEQTNGAYAAGKDTSLLATALPVTNKAPPPKAKDKPVDAPRVTGPQVVPCAVTGRPARFRDPATGLPYADRHAYAALRKLRQGTARWSALLGAYVGSVGAGARGVPEKFAGTSATGAVAEPAAAASSGA